MRGSFAMRAPKWTGRARSGVGAFLTLLAIGLLAPPSAPGDCSHPGDRPALGGDLFGPGLGPVDVPLAPVPVPCTGPQCSGRSSPPLAPSPVVPPRAKLWAVLAEAKPALPAVSLAPWPEEASSRPVRIAPSIFHPPRLPR